MSNNDDFAVTSKRTQNMSKNIVCAPSHVGDADVKFMKELWLAISVDLVFHPKLICAAIELGIDEAHVLGILVRMWLMAFKYAKDGDLWRGDDDSTLRFVGVITGYKGDVQQLVDVLRRNRWLDDWLIHDWLDYVGPFLVKSFKTSKRPWLVATWAKHGRKYGARNCADGETEPDGSSGNDMPDKEPPDNDGSPKPDPERDRNDSGTIQEATRNQTGSQQELQPKPLHNPIPRSTTIREIEPKTLSPPAQSNKKRKAPNGGVGGISSVGAVLGGMDGKDGVEPVKDRGFLNFVKEGGRAESLNTPEFILSLVTVEDTYAVYRNMLRFHGILTVRLLREKIAYCQVAPATWMILLQDKVHAAYRERDDGSLIDTNGADPVAMTIAAFRPPNGGKRHIGTEASTNLFTEVMIDFTQMLCGQESVWQSRLSGAAIAFELNRRKGKRGRIRNT